MTLETDAHLRRYARNTLWSIALFGGGAFAWGTLVPIEGAVIGNGTVVVDGNVKKVQHPQGGVVGAVLVKDGATVREGEVVARLDDTVVRSNLGIVMADLISQTLRAARLSAERDDRPDVSFPIDLVARAGNERELAQNIAGEQALFNTRRAAREGLKAQLRERLAQFGNEMASVTEQLKATEEQLSIAKQDRAILEPAIRGGFVQRPRVTALDREIERNKGLIGDATARVEQSRARMRETDVQIAQVDRDRISESSKELREAEARIADLKERRIAAEDQLRKIDIKAPISGMVHELTVHTIGGVVGPAETIMSIVPNPDDLLVEVRMSPTDRDQIAFDKPARVRFAAFNQRITPELQGKVTRISPNTSKDQQTGQTYYTVGVKLVDGQMAKLNGASLIPGMTADTFITTDQRTMVSFLMKQFVEQWQYMFRGR